MALQWKFDMKCGEITFFEKAREKEFTYALYEGNAFLIMLKEERDGKMIEWEMYNFFVDETHMKRCCGLAKGCDDLFEDAPPIRMRLDIKKHSKWKKVVELMLKAYPNLELVVYDSEAFVKDMAKKVRL